MKKTDRARDEQRLLLHIDELIDWLIDLFARCDSLGDMETPQHGNASKKRNHKTYLMSSSLN